MQCDGSVGSNPRRDEPFAVPWWRRARRLGAGVVACGALWTGAARAEPELRTTARGCEEYDLARLDELLGIEVETVRSQHPSRPTDVVLECRGAAVAVLVVLRESQGEKRGRVNPGGADPAARTRLLALTISELLAQLWSEAPEPPPAAPPESAALAKTDPERRASPASRLAEPAADDTFALVAAFATRGLFAPRAVLFGAAIGAEYRFASLLALGSSLECVFGGVGRDYANVQLQIPSASLHAVVEGRMGRLALGAGAGARFGYVRLKAVDVDPAVTGNDIGGPWGGPFALARARWSVRRVDVYAALESGVFTLPFAGTVDGEARLVEIEGVWLAGSVGLAAVF